MATYNLLPIAGAVVVLYIASWLLARTGRLQVALHRKIWNAALLLSFTGMIVFSLLNVLAYDTGINVLPPAIDVKFWHVEFGIICVLVAMFHALWHMPYFQQYLPSSPARAGGEQSRLGATQKEKPKMPAAPAQQAAPPMQPSAPEGKKE